MAGNPISDQNWAADVTNQITGFVGQVRDKTTNNAIKAVRAVVFGLFGAILGIVALVLLLLVVTRGTQVLLDLAVSWERAVYLSYLILGGLMVIVGFIVMGKRTS